MKSVAQVMTREVQSVRPDETLQRAAQLMRLLDVGSLPVCAADRLVGIVTDRDITVRATAAGLSAGEPVSTVMSDKVAVCREDDSVQDVEDRMGELQVRRMPIVDASGALAGIVAVGDLARRQSGDLDTLMRDISAPA